MMQNNYEIEAIREGTFARSVDDVDKYKKDIARDGDPMMKYQTNTNKKVYKGPPPKPNRFGIMPGYRWDGIDRGNGFEEKVLASLYAKGRKEEERYKWSCADM
jgi:pre-mRNA-splicing factor CWC26